MGFPIELAKKALIECKNTSIDAAIDLISGMQEELDVESGILKEQVTLLKPQWNCPYCTFLNETDNSVNENEDELDVLDPCCVMCGNPAPSSAFYTKEDIEQMESDKQKQITAEIENEESKRNQKSEEKAKEGDSYCPLSEISNGNLDALCFGELGHNFLDRFFVVAGFNLDNSSSGLRVRRLGYSDLYF